MVMSSYSSSSKARSRSLTYEEDLENPLCLCEYYNRHNQRAHVLMCCCNCEALDQLGTSLLCCSCYDGAEETSYSGPAMTGSSSSSLMKNFCKYLASRGRLIGETLSDCNDRLRVPFPGGARQINWDFVFSLVCLLVYISFGTINFFCSLLTIMLIPVLLYTRFFAARLAMSRGGSQGADHSGAYATHSLRELSTQRQRLARSSPSASSDPARIQIAYFVILNALSLIFVAFNYSLRDELTLLGHSEKNLISFLLLFGIGFHLYMHYSDPGFVDLKRLRQIEQERMDQELASLARKQLAESGAPDNSVHGSFVSANRQRNQLSSSDEEVNYCSKCQIKRGHSFNIGHCPVCKCCSFNRDHHCFWVDNCISYLNHKKFVCYLLFLFFFFVYSFTVLLAHLRHLDCSLIKIPFIVVQQAAEVGNHQSPPSCLFGAYYSNFNRSLIVLLFIQLVPLVSYLALLLVQQFFFISLALTQHQIFKISQKNPRFSLALYIGANLTLNSIARNWYLFCFRLRSKAHIQSRQSQLVENLV